MSAIDLKTLRAELTEDEGRILSLYYDSRGNPTIGVGHNLRAGISERICDLLLEEDMARTFAALDANVSWWRQLPDPQARVLANLCFNMGWTRLSTFHCFLSAMERGEWEKAADELRDSAWWHQVGARGPRMIARLIRT